MPGSLDANGVYQYAEDDAASPFSDLLNLGMDSISTALANLTNATDARLDVLEAGTGTVPTIARYLTSGTWNKPAHLLGIRVRMLGGNGAGGGSAVTTAGQQSVGSSGAAGAYSEAWFAAASLPSSVAVTVGTGGTGVLGAAGNAGTDTSFGAFLTAPGGPGGLTSAASTSATAATPPNGAAAGVAASSSGTALLFAGGPGQRSWSYPAAGVGMSAPGADTPFGQGGVPGLMNANGGAGSFGGGGGTVNLASQATARTGGAGGTGLVIIEHFYKVV